MVQSVRRTRRDVIERQNAAEAPGGKDGGADPGVCKGRTLGGCVVLEDLGTAIGPSAVAASLLAPCCKSSQNRHPYQNKARTIDVVSPELENAMGVLSTTKEFFLLELPFAETLHWARCGASGRQGKASERHHVLEVWEPPRDHSRNVRPRCLLHLSILVVVRLRNEAHWMKNRHRI